MKKFELGQIVKQNRGAIAHYAVVIAENRTVGWVNTSKLEVKPIEGEGWSVVNIRGEVFDIETIKKNIKSFKMSLENGDIRPYHATEFNCEHWATLMVTGKAYSTQSGTVKFATPTIVGGAMIGVGASAGTVVTIASTLGAAASTGTAIGSLSGAAATNAALAWLGGGSLAAGGGGMAAGAAIVSAVSTGGAVVAIAGVGIIGKQVWENLGEEQRQAVIEKIDNSTPDQVKVAYGVTMETAAGVFDVASGWLGEGTSKLAKAVNVATPEPVKKACDRIAEAGTNAGQAVGKQVNSAMSATWKLGGNVTSEAGKHLGNTANTVNSMFKGWTKKTGD
ncbi:hypothetical protein [Lyngbya sp. CCY1209]|uniref:hypothetical protein n=1 Tax=Lyngbya sp. CCY1209 TaxID=2886103 RepID=UPI002D20A5B1|nr:hypothetical protein [Lyngbya sp. CCY1209]MEB3887163.1 hypothetical protein [Lyngbya sp. CCY1209]